MTTASTVRGSQRFTASSPCPACGGWESAPRGRAVRCHGFIGGDGRYAHCARADRAGGLMPGRDGLYAHRVDGSCRCGADHGHGLAQRVEVTRTEPLPAPDLSRVVSRVWREARPSPGTLVQTYLEGRALRGPIPPTLRHVPRSPHRPSGRELPAMVAAVQRWPGRDVVAVHRTYLAADGSGKADVSPSRMMLGPVAGGAVRLAPVAGAVAVSEGIETGLAVMYATGVPTWAALSANGIRQLALPPVEIVHEVIIAADADAAGLGAARDAAQRWTLEGRRVRIAHPLEGDFNDVLLAGAA